MRQDGSAPVVMRRRIRSELRKARATAAQVACLVAPGEQVISRHQKRFVDLSTPSSISGF